MLYLTLCLAFSGVLRWLVLDRFHQIEANAIQTDLNRLRNSVNLELDRLGDFAKDWAVWDGMYQYAQTRDAAFVSANLDMSAFLAIHIEGAIITDPQGAVLWAFILDPVTGKPTQERAIVDSWWRSYTKSSLPYQGLYRADEGAVLFAAHPILPTGLGGDIQGEIIFLRHFGDSFVRGIKTATELPVTRFDFAKATSGPSDNLRFVDDRLAEARLILPFHNKEAEALSLELSIPRPIYQQAQQLLWWATLLLIALCSLLTLVTYYLFERHLIRPMVFLTRTAERLGRNQIDMPSLYLHHRADEVGDLARTMRSMARNMQAQKRQLIAERDQAQSHSRTDPLTGLFNRRHLAEVLQASVQDISDQAWLIFLIDIDHFKQINDQYGHEMGDEVLRQFSALLCNCIRLSDKAFRIGGEEFVLVCRESDAHLAAEIARRICKRVFKYPFGVAEAPFFVSCSIGYVSCQFGGAVINADVFQDVLKLADIALYAAKRSGRNAWVGLNFDAQAMDHSLPTSLPELEQMLTEKSATLSASTEEVTWR